MTYDLVVIGAGPGGYDAATEAAGFGIKVALVEKRDLGGTCLNRGCIPTKVILGATSAIEELSAQKKMKVADGSITVDYAALAARKEKLIAGTRKAMAQRLKQLGVDLFTGTGTVPEKGKVVVETEEGTKELDCENILVATGSKPTFFPGLEPDNDCVVDSDGFLEMTAMPESLIVVGAGYIGLEMAQAAHRMGAKITVVDAMDRVAPLEDPEVSKALRSIFKRWKWDIRLGVRVQSVKTENGKAVLTLDGGDVIEAEKALVAVGRGPVSDKLGLEALGVTLERGNVTVNDYLEAAPGIYAVGDVNGRIQLAHAASHQAHYVASRVAGKIDTPYAPGPIPSVLYGSPETMRVGLMPEELKAQGKSCETSKFAFAGNPIAQSHAATQGFCKVVWLENKVVGVTAVGHDASRLTTPATMIVQEGWTPDDIHNTIFPHPTLDEVLLNALKAERSEG
ncbi:dihydrolipoyl dehydrogenase [Salidesulfovibrio brasiliensis]|uniref:dihydrolipoyl dehydrogenase n=1 Tax=Salidesulfovibrio brasiliensis TaxID=221711 RepID=UPI0006D0424B|nr:dihydrolipoyl dehydrogenase [Salidesulfovibrio brasiliensis]